MDDRDALDIFLGGPGLDELEEYTNRLGPRILEHSEGASVRGDFFRTTRLDVVTMELVIVDFVEFRISGPEGLNPVESGAPDRRARRAGRVRGGRARRGRNGKVVRH